MILYMQRKVRDTLPIFPFTMSVAPQHHQRTNETIVLAARRRTGTPVQRVVPRARMTPVRAGIATPLNARARGGVLRAHAPPSLPPPHVPVPSMQFPQEPYDLLARCGIDSPFGRGVSRVLVFLLLFQPVYVALGAELENEPGLGNVEQQVIDEEPVEADVDIEERAKTGTDVASQEQETENREQRTEGGDEFVSTSGADDADSGALDDKQDAADAAEEPLPEARELDATETAGDEEQDETDIGADTLSSAEVGEGAAEQEQLAGEQDEAVGDSVSGEEETNDESADAETDTDGERGGGSERDDSPSAGTDDTDTTEGTDGDVEGGVTANDAEASDETEESNTNEGDNEFEEAASSLSGTAPDDGGVVSDEQALEDGGVGASAEEPEEVAEPDTPIAEHNTGNEYKFGEGDCTLVADGEFYCVAPTTKRFVEGDPRVYAELDREGDREIYHFDGVEVTRITNNEYDDFAPVFDEAVGAIAWQANVQDRLQVFYHDLEANATRQITTSRQNSSNPDIEGDRIVWQEWVGTNWEVFLAEVEPDGLEIEQLTDNGLHDMFPQVYDGLVTWQREKGSSWEVIVHNLKTGEEYAVEKDEDTKYENPRFVLLFDSKHENGDVETIGYDLDTGEMMELGTRSRPIPADPVTPKDETPEAIPREGSTPSPVKVGREDGDGAGGSGTGTGGDGGLDDDVAAPQPIDLSATGNAVTLPPVEMPGTV